MEKDKFGEISKEFGTNHNSILNELQYFHVCDGSLLPDIMHDVLMLNHMIIVENYFTLEILNTQLENIELSTKESKSRPTCV